MEWQGAFLVRARIGVAKTYWEEAPQGVTRPFVTLFDVTENRPQILKGWDLEAARVQVDAWADTIEARDAMMEAVLAAVVPGGTTSGHIFQRASIEMGPRAIGGERDGTKTIRRKQADLLFYHKPA